MKLESAVAVITGATRGVGRGVARELARERARVFITGRSVPHHEPFDEPITAIRCDHIDDPQVDAVFERIVHEAEAIDVLVNSVWGGYERMIDNGAFTHGPGLSGNSRCGAGMRCSQQEFARTITPANSPHVRWWRSAAVSS